MSKTITAQEVIDFITKGSKGRFFAVEFVKRTTGELRMMNCRYGVRKGVKGVGAPYKAEDYGLIRVWERNNDKFFRTIPVDGVVRIEIDGEWYEVE